MIHEHQKLNACYTENIFKWQVKSNSLPNINLFQTIIMHVVHPIYILIGNFVSDFSLISSSSPITT